LRIYDPIGGLRRTDNSNDEMRGFFAVLRMTSVIETMTTFGAVERAENQLLEFGEDEADSAYDVVGWGFVCC